MQQPLYDTEAVAIGVAVNQVLFFQRQLGQADASAVIAAKTIGETNLQQPGQLANPLEFSVFGFLFEVTPAIVLADFNAIYATGVFVFTYTGNRTYLQVPLMRIPQGVSPEGFATTTVGATTIQQMHNGVGHVSNLYKFTIGRSALRIRPTESFQVQISWPIGAITPTANTRLRVYIVGLMWTAL